MRKLERLGAEEVARRADTPVTGGLPGDDHLRGHGRCRRVPSGWSAISRTRRAARRRHPRPPVRGVCSVPTCRSSAPLGSSRSTGRSSSARRGARSADVDPSPSRRVGPPSTAWAGAATAGDELLLQTAARRPTWWSSQQRVAGPTRAGRADRAHASDRGGSRDADRTWPTWSNASRLYRRPHRATGARGDRSRARRRIRAARRHRPCSRPAPKGWCRTGIEPRPVLGELARLRARTGRGRKRRHRSGALGVHGVR